MIRRTSTAALLLAGLVSAASAQLVTRSFVFSSKYVPASTGEATAFAAVTPNGRFAVVTSIAGGNSVLSIHFRSGGIASSVSLGPIRKVAKLLVAADGSITVVASEPTAFDGLDVRVQRFDANLAPIYSVLFHNAFGDLDDEPCDAALGAGDSLYTMVQTEIAGGTKAIYYQLAQATGAVVNSRASSILNSKSTSSKCQTVLQMGSGHVVGAVTTVDGTTFGIEVFESNLAVRGGFTTTGNLVERVSASAVRGNEAILAVREPGFGTRIGHITETPTLISFNPLLLLEDLIARSVTLDAGTAYVSGTNDLATSAKIVKLDTTASTPAVITTKSLAFTAGAAHVGGLAILESTGDQYYLYSVQSSTANTAKYAVLKLSSSLSTRWSLLTDPLPASAADFPTTFAEHLASGDIYVGGADLATVCDIGLLQVPVAISDSFTAKKNLVFNSPRTVTFNDRYVLGTTISLDTPAAHGTVVINANKTFTYTPNTNFVGTDTFKYKLTKPGLNSVTALVSVRVTN